MKLQAWCMRPFAPFDGSRTETFHSRWTHFSLILGNGLCQVDQGFEVKSIFNSSYQHRRLSFLGTRSTCGYFLSHYGKYNISFFKWNPNNIIKLFLTDWEGYLVYKSSSSSGRAVLCASCWSEENKRERIESVVRRKVVHSCLANHSAK